VLLGLAVGVPAALATTRLLVSRLYGVRATDPLTFAAALAVVVGVCASASFMPAYRASRVDPMTALRCE